MKFSYLKLRLGEGPNEPIRPRPFIRVRISTRENASDFIWIYALIDSGADQSVLPAEIARRLHIDLGASPSVAVKGIGGGRANAQMHPVTIAVDESWKMIIAVAFVDDEQTLPILGQEGFFDHAIVTFNRPKEEIELRPIILR